MNCSIYLPICADLPFCASTLEDFKDSMLGVFDLMSTPFAIDFTFSFERIFSRDLLLFFVIVLEFEIPAVLA